MDLFQIKFHSTQTLGPYNPDRHFLKSSFSNVFSVICTPYASGIWSSPCDLAGRRPTRSDEWEIFLFLFAAVGSVRTAFWHQFHIQRYLVLGSPIFHYSRFPRILQQVLIQIAHTYSTTYHKICQINVLFNTNGPCCFCAPLAQMPLVCLLA